MTLDTRRIRALCFDLDGTLSDTDDLWVHKLELLFRPFRFLYRNRDVYAFTRWAVMGLETPGNLLYHWFDRFSFNCPQTNNPRPDYTQAAGSEMTNNDNAV